MAYTREIDRRHNLEHSRKGDRGARGDARGGSGEHPRHTKTPAPKARLDIIEAAINRANQDAHVFLSRRKTGPKTPLFKISAFAVCMAICFCIAVFVIHSHQKIRDDQWRNTAIAIRSDMQKMASMYVERLEKTGRIPAAPEGLLKAEAGFVPAWKCLPDPPKGMTWSLGKIKTDDFGSIPAVMLIGDAAPELCVALNSIRDDHRGRPATQNPAPECAAIDTGIIIALPVPEISAGTAGRLPQGNKKRNKTTK